MKKQTELDSFDIKYDDVKAYIKHYNADKWVSMITVHGNLITLTFPTIPESLLDELRDSWRFVATESGEGTKVKVTLDFSRLRS